MKIKTSQFGEIEFDSDIVINFPDGIFGFEDLKRFIIVEDEDFRPFRWLVSVDEPEIGFAILEPSFIVADYYDRVGFNPENFALFGIVKFGKEISETTINLKAPVVIEKKKNLGRQIILENVEFDISHKIFTE